MIPALEDKVKPTIYQTKTVMQKNETKARPASSYTLLSDANDLTPTAPSKHHSCCTQQPPSSASQKDGEQSAQAKSKRECSPQCIISASFPKVAPRRRKEKKAKTHTKSYHLCLPCPLPGNKVHVVRQKRPHLPSFALIHPRRNPFPALSVHAQVPLHDSAKSQNQFLLSRREPKSAASSLRSFRSLMANCIKSGK